MAFTVDAILSLAVIQDVLQIIGDFNVTRFLYFVVSSVNLQFGYYGDIFTDE